MIHGNEVAVMQKTENGVEGTIPFEDDENTSELIKNTCKIASRFNGSKYSIFIPTAEAFYILQEELGVKDFEKFLQDMLESKRLVWTETTSRAGKKFLDWIQSIIINEGIVLFYLTILWKGLKNIN